MKTIYSLVAAGAVTALITGFTSKPPLTQDVLQVNPDSVSLKLENDRVRVLEAVLEPGAKEKMHSHPAYVTYVISGGKVRIYSSGKTTDTELKTGEILYREAVTHWGENIGATPIRLMMVELKSQN